MSRGSKLGHMIKRLPVVLMVASVAVLAQKPDGAGVNSPWSAAEVIHPADLAKLVQAKSDTPLVVHVGFLFHFDSKHIPGAVYAGPGREEAGLAALRKAVANVPKDREIVLYCGCCPWDQCPNMKPAFNLLHGLGYTKIRVTEMPTSFLKDWIEKGYPVEGAAPGAAPIR